MVFALQLVAVAGLLVVLSRRVDLTFGGPQAISRATEFLGPTGPPLPPPSPPPPSTTHQSSWVPPPSLPPLSPRISCRLRGSRRSGGSYICCCSLPAFDILILPRE